MDKVAIARPTDREHILALETCGKGLIGMLLRKSKTGEKEMKSPTVSARLGIQLVKSVQENMRSGDEYLSPNGICA
jgi:hypothetical protein